MARRRSRDIQLRVYLTASVPNVWTLGYHAESKSLSAHRRLVVAHEIHIRRRLNSTVNGSLCFCFIIRSIFSSSRRDSQCPTGERHSVHEDPKTQLI